MPEVSKKLARSGEGWGEKKSAHLALSHYSIFFAHTHSFVPFKSVFENAYVSSTRLNDQSFWYLDCKQSLSAHFYKDYCTCSLSMNDLNIVYMYKEKKL